MRGDVRGAQAMALGARVLSKGERPGGVREKTSRRLKTNPTLTSSLSSPPSRVAWLPVDPAAQALAVPFLAIDMHAIQGEAPGGLGPCVYLQLSVEDEAGGGGGANGASASDDDGDDTASPSGGEVRLIPADPANVDVIFTAMCECAALNPDPGAVGAEEGGDGELFFDREAAAAGAAAARLDALLVEDPARFEDPPEEEEG